MQPFLSKLPFRGLSPLQKAWVNYRFLGDALRSRAWDSAAWQLSQLLERIEEIEDGYEKGESSDPQEEASLDGR